MIGSARKALHKLVVTGFRPGSRSFLFKLGAKAYQLPEYCLDRIQNISGVRNQMSAIFVKRDLLFWVYRLAIDGSAILFSGLKARLKQMSSSAEGA
jgi:hypothetical protein